MLLLIMNSSLESLESEEDLILIDQLNLIQELQRKGALRMKPPRKYQRDFSSDEDFGSSKGSHYSIPQGH